MSNHIKDILFALSDGGVEYIVGGGVAAVMHGVERVTLDIDISLHFTEDNLKRFVVVMEKLGMKPRVPVPLEVLGDPRAVRMMVSEKHAVVFSLINPRDPLRYVDVFLTEQLAYPSLMKDAVVVDVDGHAVFVIGRRRLLEIKKSIQPPREKDRLDIIELERLEHENN